MIVIEKATIKDMPQIAKMGKAFFKEAGWEDVAEWDDEAAFDALLKTIENHTVFVAKKGDETIGMISAILTPLWFNPKYVNAQEFFWYVKPEERGGVGLKLYYALEDEVRKLGAQSLTMLSVKAMPSLDNLYKKLGYRPAENTFMKRL